MEHPGLLLISEANPPQRDALYDYFFEAYPTWAEIADGTPKQAWIFSLLARSEDQENRLVRLQRLEWNTIEHSILEWKKRAAVLKHVLKGLPQHP
jgi:hypothetical protein